MLNPSGRKWTEGCVAAWRQIRALPLIQRMIALACAVLMMFGGPAAMLMVFVGDRSLRTAGVGLLILVLLGTFGATIFSAVRACRAPPARAKR